ncbi:MAG: hypothetical protein O7G13_18065, partial [Alphaproteobacteria bacterium]|nr:hypothetical protein [Alphaproteobacteria bacterium]
INIQAVGLNGAEAYVQLKRRRLAQFEGAHRLPPSEANATAAAIDLTARICLRVMLLSLLKLLLTRLWQPV